MRQHHQAERTDDQTEYVMEQARLKIHPVQGQLIRARSVK